MCKGCGKCKEKVIEDIKNQTIGLSDAELRELFDYVLKKGYLPAVVLEMWLANLAYDKKTEAMETSFAQNMEHGE